MPKLNREHIVFITSLFIWGYFGFLYLNYHYFHVTWVLLGVFQEILSIPLLVLHLVLFLIAAIWWVENPRFNRLIFWNGLLLLISNALLINQLFFE
jgi:hypothetical protein